MRYLSGCLRRVRLTVVPLHDAEIREGAVQAHVRDEAVLGHVGHLVAQGPVKSVAAFCNGGLVKAADGAILVSAEHVGAHMPRLVETIKEPHKHGQPQHPRHATECFPRRLTGSVKIHDVRQDRKPSRKHVGDAIWALCKLEHLKPDEHAMRAEKVAHSRSEDR